MVRKWILEGIFLTFSSVRIFPPWGRLANRSGALSCYCLRRIRASATHGLPDA